eukprot:735177-Prymnesium_polylepis.1
MGRVCARRQVRKRACVWGMWAVVGHERAHQDRTAMVEGCGTGGGALEALAERHRKELHVGGGGRRPTRCVVSVYDITV